nr:phage major tail protein 2 [uncultured Mediterranean phage uvMED]
MAIWIGEAGGIRIAGPSSERIYTRIDPGDVDASAKRFGFEDGRFTLITGDRIWIRRIDSNGNPEGILDFVAASGWSDGVQRPDGQWFVYVDGVGGLRLFKEWADAINNEKGKAVSLNSISAGYRVSYEVVQGEEECLGQTIGWTLNTDRDVADFTSLGDNFKQRMSTMISGSGDLDCYFDYENRLCSDNEGTFPSVYMHNLALRQEIGANFIGVFLMKRSNAVPLNELLTREEAFPELFYRVECVITGVATELVYDQPIHSKITFVTTGPIQLLMGYPSGYLLQEQPPNDKILRESGFGILLETPT